MKRYFLLLMVVLLNLACLLPVPFPAPAAATATTAWVPVATLETTNTPFAPGSASPTPAATLFFTASPSTTFTPTPREPARSTITASPTPTATTIAAATSQPTRTATTTSSPVTASATPVTASATPGGGGGGTCLVTNDGYASAVVTLINNERANAGLPALTVNSTLMANSQNWSATMALTNTFVHSGQPVGENIAAGYASPGAAVAGWMASSGHRANILDPSYTQVGAGYAFCSSSTYGHYWTAQFLP